MKLPPRSDWISLADAARILGCSNNSVRRAISHGKADRNKGNKRHYLVAWDTLGGLVTTKEQCDEFMKSLNGFHE